MSQDGWCDDLNNAAANAVRLVFALCLSTEMPLASAIPGVAFDYGFFSLLRLKIRLVSNWPLGVSK